MKRFNRLALATVSASAILAAPAADACTSLGYTDAQGNHYYGRTMELNVEMPYLVIYVPQGQAFRSQAPGERAINYTGRHRFLAVGAPERAPTAARPLEIRDVGVAEGLNEAGLTFSILAYPEAGSGDKAVRHTRAALQATDLGSWILSQFATVEEVKAGLKKQPVFLTRIAVAGDVEYPFHVAVHDRTGASIVIEWHRGKKTVTDNPVGVMTNGPEFSWHLTNLNNWTHLTNVDSSTAKFGSLAVNQPDSGIATAALPGANTSVGRFIRAVYYTNFAEKAETADTAMLTLARIMNNFDRPKGITIDLPGADGEGVTFQGTGQKEGAPSTEYTSFTALHDLNRGRIMLRPYSAFNYTSFDMSRMPAADGIRVLPMTKLDSAGGDGTAALLAGRMP